MAAVTQKVSNYLGGVSQQPEELMLPGQVLEAQNTYVDPALGLIKRSGFEYIADLPIEPTTALRFGKWFPIFLTPTAQFFCCVGAGTVRVFGTDGLERPVATPVGVGYLNTISDSNDVAVVTVNESTFIANKKVQVIARNPPDPNQLINLRPPFFPNRVATVVITEVHYGAKYSLTFKLDGVTTTITYTTFNAEAPITAPSQTERTVTANQILLGLKALLPAGYDGVIVGNTLEIIRKEGTLSFTVTSTGALSEIGLYVFQDEISDVSRLPGKSVDGRVVKISNTPDSREDDYWLKFTAWNSTAGDGYWTEWIAPYASDGFDPNTAPHQLTYNASTDSFTFDLIPWIDRLVGEDSTNPHPSFVNKTVRSMFFHNNRFGILTDETIVMSQTNDFFNFYASSVLATVDTDPIDRSVSSTSPVELFAVHPTKQGLLLFADNQQFLAEAVDNVYTPSTTTITSISNFECDPHVDPVNLGTTVAFLSKSRGWTKVFEMLSRGQNEQPEIADLTRIVPEWIPEDVNTLASNPQTGTIFVAKRNPYNLTSSIHVFKYWQDGQSRNQAWSTWTTPEPPLLLYPHKEQLWVITYGDNRDNGLGGLTERFGLCKLELSTRVNTYTSPFYFTIERGPLEFPSEINRTDPRLDYLAVCEDLVWDPETNYGQTKVYLPARYTPTNPFFFNTTNAVVTTNPSNSIGADVLRTATPIFYESSGPYIGRYYTTVVGEDLTTLPAGKKVIYGLLFNTRVELPRTYFRTGQGYADTDFTASLTIGRMKFMCGMTGPIQFYLRTKGRASWTKVETIPAADYYIEGSAPIVNSKMFTLPIHQKTENFSVRIDSPSVYPFTLTSSTWEGNYVPRFYRRT